MDPDKLKKEVAKINWYHRIDLGHGIITPGTNNNFRTLRRIRLPEDLLGKTVLDIGAWDGFYSFEAERRGAKRVLAVDLWEGAVSKSGFDLARKVLNSKVEDKKIDVLNLSLEKVGVFDLVLFLGVLYHVRHPLLALEKVFSVTGKQLILETHVDLLLTKRPAMKFYPGAELDQDPTSWWGPNPAAIKMMLNDVGFRKVKLVSKFRSLPYRVAKAIYFQLKMQAPFFQTIQQDRVVFHAWR